MNHIGLKSVFYIDSQNRPRVAAMTGSCGRRDRLQSKKSLVGTDRGWASIFFSRADNQKKTGKRSKIAKKGRNVPYFDGFDILKYDELVHGRGIKHVAS